MNKSKFVSFGGHVIKLLAPITAKKVTLGFDCDVMPKGTRIKRCDLGVGADGYSFIKFGFGGKIGISNIKTDKSNAWENL